MEAVFLHLVNMSITAGWLVLAVLLLRLVFRRAPKWIHCLLWALVAVRLVCPFSFESVLSLIPSAETVPVDTFLYDTPTIHSGVPAVDAVINPVISDSFAPQTMNSVNPMQVVSILAAYVWVLGMVMMALYMVITTLRLKWRVRESVRVQRNIWQCDRIATPFILGIIRPRIYLPTTLSEADRLSVVAHEEAHIRRRDHWWKPLGFLLLTVYWFNPLLWLGYVLLCRDIEAACDQRVIRDMDVTQRKSYSETLLACSAPRHLVTACPLAFGETGVKSRIKAVLSYKKPAFWVIVLAVVAAVVAAVCLLTNPRSTVSEDLDAVGLRKTDSDQFGDPNDDSGDNLFAGKVTQVANGTMLIKCYENEKFNEVWVNYAYYFPKLDPQVGEEYLISHSDYVMETYPPQVTAERITPISPTANASDYISETEAIGIAADYWDVQPGEKDTETGYVISIYAIDAPTEDDPLYRMGLRYLMAEEGGTGDFQLVDTLLVHAVTGEIALPAAPN